MTTSQENDETTTAKNGSATSRTPVANWSEWLTAGEVAHRLLCTRQQVYRLERDGELRAMVGNWRGKIVRKFDPVQVAKIAPRELTASVDDELADEFDEVDPSRLLAQFLKESRQIATDFRRGQHEAYQLVAAPSRELHNLTLEALKTANARIKELEGQLNAAFDERRDERREDREFALFERTQREQSDRQQQFFQMFVAKAPVIFSQLLEGLRGAKGPLAEWMQAQSPDQQKQLITAIQAVMSVEAEAKGESNEPPPTI